MGPRGSKGVPTWLKIAPKSVLKAVLDGSGGHLGPKSQQYPQQLVRPLLVPPFLGPKMEAKTHPK
eukprot:1140631-Karenia_brevis.AAC.1